MIPSFLPSLLGVRRHADLKIKTWPDVKGNTWVRDPESESDEFLKSTKLVIEIISVLLEIVRR